MKKYDFQQQLAKGEQYEHELDSHFSPLYMIEPATREEQKRGIDRKFTDPQTGFKVTIEYKTDERASLSGNAFVETISVKKPHFRRLGWAYTCQADYLVYFIPGDGHVIYKIPLGLLRSRLGRWSKKYPKVSIPNKDYQTVGLLIPLFEFEKIAEIVA